MKAGSTEVAEVGHGLALDWTITCFLLVRSGSAAPAEGAERGGNQCELVPAFAHELHLDGFSYFVMGIL